MATPTQDEAEAELDMSQQSSGGVVDVFDTSVSTAIVVEDNEELCMFMVSHLKSIFKKVYYAFNGRDAMMMIKRDSPDIVIAEGILPVLSGFDLCREMKSSSELRHIPIILITAGSAEAGKLKSYALGADSYISKPFDVNVLISRCKNLLLNREIVRNRYRNTPKGVPVEEKKMSNADESFLMKIDELIESLISQPDFGVDMIVDKMLVSRSALYSRFKELTGKSIGTYITEYRLARAKEMLRHGDMPINEISEALGFRSQRYFSTFFRERTGTTPTAFRTSRPDTTDNEAQ
jgi:DNA-binding response OmpR family regulator